MNKIKEMKERISGIKDTIEGMDILVKVHIKIKNSRNPGTLWKDKNLRRVEVESGGKSNVQGPENVFNNTTDKDFPSLKKEMALKV